MRHATREPGAGAIGLRQKSERRAAARGDLDREVQAAAPAFSALKTWAQVPVVVSLSGLDDGRGLVVAEKYDATPEKYPRRPGMPSKRPLAKE